MAESHLLRVSPHDNIQFTRVENDLCGTVKIQNVDSTALTYKIKTTAPEKFRVRPSSGILNKGESITIAVVFNHGHPLSSLCREKFLVMSMKLPNGQGDHDASHLAEMWKTMAASGTEIEQHRLRCNLADGITDNTLKNGKTLEGSFEMSSNLSGSSSGGASGLHVPAIQNQLQELRSAMSFNQKLQWITIVLVILLSIAIVYIIKFEIQNNSYEYCVRQ